MEPVSRFMGAVSVYSSQDHLFIPKQDSGENVQLTTETVQSVNGDVTVTMAIKGTGKHQIDIKTFNATANLESWQISLSAGKQEKIQLILKVTDQTVPYVAVISVDQNPGLRKEIVGAYSEDSILAAK